MRLCRVHRWRQNKGLERLRYESQWGGYGMGYVAILLMLNHWGLLIPEWGSSINGLLYVVNFMFSHLCAVREWVQCTIVPIHTENMELSTLWVLKWGRHSNIDPGAIHCKCAEILCFFVSVYRLHCHHPRPPAGNKLLISQRSPPVQYYKWIGMECALKMLFDSPWKEVWLIVRGAILWAEVSFPAGLWQLCNACLRSVCVCFFN